MTASNLTLPAWASGKTEVGNVGIGSADAFADLVTVTNTTTGKTLATMPIPYDPSAVGDGPISANGSHDRQIGFFMPAGADGGGQIQFSVTTNYQHQVVETDSSPDANNMQILTVTSAVLLADLNVANLTVTPASGLKSGSALVVHWDDQNIGNLAVSASFSDSITIRNLTTGQSLITAPVFYDVSAAGNGPIGSGGSSRARQFAFTLPDGAAGVGQIGFSLTADVYNQIAESDKTNNSASATKPIRIEANCAAAFGSAKENQALYIPVVNAGTPK